MYLFVLMEYKPYVVKNIIHHPLQFIVGDGLFSLIVENNYSFVSFVGFTQGFVNKVSGSINQYVVSS